MATNEVSNTEETALDPNDAKIVLDVHDFPDIFAEEGSVETRIVRHSMRMKEAHSKVSVDADGSILIVKRPGAKLRFEIAPTEYFPIGISFQLTAGIANPTTLERLGFHNFSDMKLHPNFNILTIKDDFKDDDDNDHYKFSIILQRGADGKLGILDPSIRHRPS